MNAAGVTAQNDRARSLALTSERCHETPDCGVYEVKVEMVFALKGRHSIAGGVAPGY